MRQQRKSIEKTNSENQQRKQSHITPQQRQVLVSKR
jgi:hypothetical protein